MIEQLNQGTAGESKKQHGWVGVDGFVDLFCAACVSGAAWLDLLACLLVLWGRYMSLCGGVGWDGVWLGCETGTVLGDTAVPLPVRTWGASHTPDDDLA